MKFRLALLSLQSYVSGSGASQSRKLSWNAPSPFRQCERFRLCAELIIAFGRGQWLSAGSVELHLERVTIRQHVDATEIVGLGKTPGGIVHGSTVAGDGKGVRRARVP